MNNLHKKYDVIGIGNALLDLTFNVSDEFLNNLRLQKNAMVLIDDTKSREILVKIDIKKAKISPGGGCSNTIAGISFLGGKTAFFCVVGKDQYGEIYEKQTREMGVIPFFTKHEDKSTGYALTFITPDLERTFATNLGASIYLKKEHFLEEEIKNAKIIHLEAYQLEDLNLRNELFHVIDIAKKNNIKISLDLSDSNLVKRNLGFLKEFIKTNVSILFANKDESESFCNKKEKEALNELSKYCEICIVKLGAKGSLIKFDNEIYEVKPYKNKVINTNGVGDMFAAGFLYGLTHGLDIAKSGDLASYAASLVVGSESARLDLKDKEKLINKVNTLVNS